MVNTLYFGDTRSVDILRKPIADNRIDPIYLDQAFNSKHHDALLFKTRRGHSLDDYDRQAVTLP